MAFFEVWHKIILSGRKWHRNGPKLMLYLKVFKGLIIGDLIGKCGIRKKAICAKPRDNFGGTEGHFPGKKKKQRVRM